MEVLISISLRMLLNIAIVEDHSNESISRGSVADISRLIEL